MSPRTVVKPAPVLMVHGAFCGGWVFERLAGAFAAAGHPVSAPDLPGHGADEPRDAASGLSMSVYATAIAAEARALGAPPVLVGHSMGGLVALLAAAQVPTAGVILLAPSAPWGVSGSTMEEAVSAVSLYALGPYWAQAIEPDYASFAGYGVDRLPGAERHAAFARMRRESGRALFETLNWWLDPFMTTSVSVDRIKAPALVAVGARDMIHPPATVRQTAERLKADFRVFDGMSHWLLAEPGWDTVAKACLEWTAGHLAEAAA